MYWKKWNRADSLKLWRLTTRIAQYILQKLRTPVLCFGILYIFVSYGVIRMLTILIHAHSLWLLHWLRDCSSAIEIILTSVDKSDLCQAWPQYDDVIKWRHFPRYWSFVRGIHRSPVNSPQKGQWRVALMFLWSVPWINSWVNNREAVDLARHCAHYDVIVMMSL